MKKVLVLGAGGYLGAHISSHLVKSGFQVSAFCHRPPDPKSEWARGMDVVLSGDVRDEKILDQASALQVDSVVHLISLDHKKSDGDPAYVRSINVDPARFLLERMAPKRLPQFLYFSTQQVLGPLSPSKIKEDFSPQPKNQYGKTHLEVEEICIDFHRRTSTNALIFRLSNGYGAPIFPDNNCWWLVVNDLCQMAFNKKELRLLSDGSPQRDFIHVSDVARAVSFFCQMEGRKFDQPIFNLSSSQTLTILELARLVQKVHFSRYNKKVPILLPGDVLAPESGHPVPGGRFKIDNQKITSLGFELKVGLEEGIGMLFEYLETR